VVDGKLLEELRMVNTENKLVKKNHYELIISGDGFIDQINYHYDSDSDCEPIFDCAKSNCSSGTSEYVQMLRCDYENFCYHYFWEQPDAGFYAKGNFKREKFKGEWYSYVPPSRNDNIKLGFSDRGNIEQLSREVVEFRINVIKGLYAFHVRLTDDQILEQSISDLFDKYADKS